MNHESINTLRAAESNLSYDNIISALKTALIHAEGGAEPQALYRLGIATGMAIYVLRGQAYSQVNDKLVTAYSELCFPVEGNAPAIASIESAIFQLEQLKQHAAA